MNMLWMHLLPLFFVYADLPLRVHHRARELAKGTISTATDDSKNVFADLTEHSVSTGLYKSKEVMHYQHVLLKRNIRFSDFVT